MAAIEAIATTYLEADAASVTFSSIPQTYEHLQLRGSCRMDLSGSMYGSLYLQMGDGSIDTGTNYSTHMMYGAATSTTGGAATGATSINLRATPDGPSTRFPYYGRIVVDLLDYVNTDKNTTTFGVCGTGNAEQVALVSGLWDSTAAVDTIKLAPSAGNWFHGSEFTLYGLNSS
jgi:hypothetical protein